MNLTDKHKTAEPLRLSGAYEDGCIYAIVLDDGLGNIEMATDRTFTTLNGARRGMSELYSSDNFDGIELNITAMLPYKVEDIR